MGCPLFVQTSIQTGKTGKQWTQGNKSSKLLIVKNLGANLQAERKKHG